MLSECVCIYETKYFVDTPICETQMNKTHIITAARSKANKSVTQSVNSASTKAGKSLFSNPPLLKVFN